MRYGDLEFDSTDKPPWSEAATAIAFYAVVGWGVIIGAVKHFLF